MLVVLLLGLASLQYRFAGETARGGDSGAPPRPAAAEALPEPPARPHLCVGPQGDRAPAHQLIPQK